MSFKVGDIVVMVDDVLNLKNAEGVIIEVLDDKKGMLKIDFGNGKTYFIWPERIRKVLPNMWIELEKSLEEAVIRD